MKRLDLLGLGGRSALAGRPCRASSPPPRPLRTGSCMDPMGCWATSTGASTTGLTDAASPRPAAPPPARRSSRCSAVGSTRSRRPFRRSTACSATWARLALWPRSWPRWPPSASSRHGVRPPGHRGRRARALSHPSRLHGKCTPLSLLEEKTERSTSLIAARREKNAWGEPIQVSEWC